MDRNLSDDPMRRFDIVDRHHATVKRMTNFIAGYRGSITDPVTAAIIDLRILSLATAKSMADLADDDGLRQTIRRITIAGFVVENQWRSPWRELVNHELPGDGDPDLDLTPFEPYLLDVEISEITIRTEFDDDVQAVRAILLKHGLDAANEESLCLLIAMSIRLTAHGDASRDFFEADLWAVIAANAIDPDDPAWHWVVESLLAT